MDIKPYLLFAGATDDNVNNRGWNSYQESFNSVEEARKYYDKWGFRWGQIVDLELEVIVEFTVGVDR